MEVKDGERAIFFAFPLDELNYNKSLNELKVLSFVTFNEVTWEIHAALAPVVSVVISTKHGGVRELPPDAFRVAEVGMNARAAYLRFYIDAERLQESVQTLQRLLQVMNNAYSESLYKIVQPQYERLSQLMKDNRAGSITDSAESEQPQVGRLSRMLKEKRKEKAG